MEFDSHKDRHANVGEGEIGENGFEEFINHNKVKELPFILEVPGENRSGPRKTDIEKMKLLYK